MKNPLKRVYGGMILRGKRSIQDVLKTLKKEYLRHRGITKIGEVRQPILVTIKSLSGLAGI
jgi:hypothetical protein